MLGIAVRWWSPAMRSPPSAVGAWFWRGGWARCGWHRVGGRISAEWPRKFVGLVIIFGGVFAATVSAGAGLF